MSDKLIEMDSLNRDSDSCVGVEVSVKSGSEEVVKMPVTNEEGSSPAVAKKKSMRKIFSRCCEVTFMTLILLAIISLFTTPTIFHFLPDPVPQVTIAAAHHIAS